MRSEQEPHRTISVDFEGERVMVYEWKGRGPTIWVGHGWSSNALAMLPLIDRLRQAGYGVLACDQVAHGESTGRRASLPRFARLTQHLIETRGPVAAGVGHSLGAAALAISRKSKGWNLPLVLLAPPADSATLFRQVGARLKLSHSVVEALLATLEEQEGMSFQEGVPEHTMDGVTASTLVVLGQSDPVIVEEEARRYLLTPQVDWLAVPDAGHGSVTRDPRSLEAVEAWLKARL
jgi:alpha-beta hydrolase superfamily lysophospholipase